MPLHSPDGANLINRYLKENNVHYDKFNWKNEQGGIEPFNPNSDMSFADFRAKMKEEWLASDPLE